ncbi:MAG: hypothetical protein ACK5LY_07370 [Lachnospirales bacterium]
MNIINVKINESVNNIKFGIDRNEVRTLMGDVFKEFKKNKFSKNTTDDYEYCHVFYDEDNKFEAIEFFEDTEVYIDEKLIFPNTLNTVKILFDNIEEDYGSFISKENSIAFYCPNNVVECVLIGCKNYYN